ncbi:MAG: DUF3783 domain-containing protein [Smithellaceae bacterium]|nr:DUF3783 domain-containing protein [Smithellaceae bacterium]
MKEKIICFALGLSGGDIEKGKASFGQMNEGTRELDVIAVSDAMLAATVEEALGQADRTKGGQTPVLSGNRVVMVNTQERPLVLQVLRSFKAVLSDPQDLIFAVITDTARTWTFGEYLGHLKREHEYLKTHRPENEPDMKRM